MKTIATILILFTTILSYAQNGCKIEEWRILANQGEYKKAIDYLKTQADTSSKKVQHSIYWHIGQLYAENNKYDEAIKYMRKSTTQLFLVFDREWRLYYKGTIAFLNRNEKKLKRINKRLWNNHSAYYHKNACILNSLSQNFDTTYKVAYQSAETP